MLWRHTSNPLPLSLLDVKIIPSTLSPFVQQLSPYCFCLLLYPPYLLFLYPSTLQGQIPEMSLMWHMTLYREPHQHTSLFLCICVCVCQTYVLHPPLGDKPLQQCEWMHVCTCVCMCMCEIRLCLTVAPIPADSAGIRSDLLCQQQPPSSIPLSFLPFPFPWLPDEGEREGERESYNSPHFSMCMHVVSD